MGMKHPEFTRRDTLPANAHDYKEREAVRRKSGLFELLNRVPTPVTLSRPSPSPLTFPRRFWLFQSNDLSVSVIYEPNPCHDRKLRRHIDRALPYPSKQAMAEQIERLRPSGTLTFHALCVFFTHVHDLGLSLFAGVFFWSFDIFGGIRRDVLGGAIGFSIPTGLKLSAQQRC